MGVTIVTDSTCDLSPQMLNEFGIKMVPLKVFLKMKFIKTG